MSLTHIGACVGHSISWRDQVIANLGGASEHVSRPNLTSSTKSRVVARLSIVPNGACETARFTKKFVGARGGKRSRWAFEGRACGGARASEGHTRPDPVLARASCVQIRSEASVACESATASVSHSDACSSAATHRWEQVRAGGCGTLQGRDVGPSAIETRDRISLRCISCSTEPGAKVFIQRLCACWTHSVRRGVQVGTHSEVAEQWRSSPNLVVAGTCGLTREVLVAVAAEEGASVPLNLVGAVLRHSPRRIGKKWAGQRGASQRSATPSQRRSASSH